jgi:putative nucleotidyltransferase with HDIG domain
VCSNERIRAELDGILLSNNVRMGLNGLYNTGLLAHILPEVHYAMGVVQNQHHAETVGEHLILTASAIRKPSRLLRWAALLHDIGKPKVRRFDKKKKDYTFYNHEIEGAFMVKSILRRLKFSNKEIDYIFRVIYHHMFYITDKTKISTVRGWMYRAGRDTVRDIMRLRIADRAGNLAKETGVTRHLKMLLRMVRRIEKEEKIMKVTDLKINGNDLKKLGLGGKDIGTTLNWLLVRCIRNPRLNVRRKLISLVQTKRNKESTSISDTSIRTNKKQRKKDHR